MVYQGKGVILYIKGKGVWHIKVTESYSMSRQNWVYHITSKGLLIYQGKKGIQSLQKACKVLLDHDKMQFISI